MGYGRKKDGVIQGRSLTKTGSEASLGVRKKKAKKEESSVSEVPVREVKNRLFVKKGKSDPGKDRKEKEALAQRE